MLRRATKNDAEGIAKVHVDVWRSTYRAIIPEEYLLRLAYTAREEMWTNILSRPDPFSHVWVSTDPDGKIIGFSNGGKKRDASLPFDGEIYAIYVLEEQQKRGHGKRLFLESLEQLHRGGFNQMFLWVIEENPACSFYAAMGGKPIAEKWDEIGGKKIKEVAYAWEDVLATLKNLKTGLRHPCIKHWSDIQGSEIRSSTGEAFGSGVAVGRFFDFSRIGIHYCVLEPGQRSSLPHAEKMEDEFVFVVRGYPDAWIDGTLYPLKPGDHIGFQAGTGICHSFLNNSADEVHLLVGGDRTRPDNQYFYALDLNKAENEKAGSNFWADHPSRTMGAHDGLPKKVRD